MTVPPSIRTRLTATLFSGVALATTAYIAAITVSTLAARSITGSAGLAGIPATLAVIGTASGAALLSADAARRGRRRGLILGYSCAAVGGLIAAWGVNRSSFLLLAGGMAILGFGQASSQLSRYAAAEIAEPARRGTAVSLIVWAGTVGAVAGPALLEPAAGFATAAGRPEYVGGYGLAALFMALAALTYTIALRPAHAEVTAQPGETSKTLRFGQALTNPNVRLALISMVFGQIVMVLIMTGTPIHIEDAGGGLDAVGTVISAHTLGMFAFSPLTGRLVDVFGPVRVLVGSVALLAVSAVLAAAAPPSSTIMLTAGLFLLGVGWNGGFVAGSSLVAASVGTRMQGAVDAVIWTSSALASLSSGVILATVGYRALSLTGLALVAFPALGLATLRRRLVTV
ncbi:MAG: MFS transporter [Acidimicrobiia bacterium]|nr:MFS transporter [Acidimicrobiia bacterium]